MEEDIWVYVVINSTNMKGVISQREKNLSPIQPIMKKNTTISCKRLTHGNRYHIFSHFYRIYFEFLTIASETSPIREYFPSETSHSLFYHGSVFYFTN